MKNSILQWRFQYNRVDFNTTLILSIQHCVFQYYIGWFQYYIRWFQYYSIQVVVLSSIEIQYYSILLNTTRGNLQMKTGLRKTYDYDIYGWGSGSFTRGKAGLRKHGVLRACETEN